MDDRGEGTVASAVAFVILAVLFVGMLAGALWVNQAIGLMDSPDLECGGVDLSDRPADTIVLYEHTDHGLLGETTHDGALVIYEDGSYTDTGPMDLPDDYSLAYSRGGLSVLDNGSEYVVVDTQDRSVRRGPATSDETDELLGQDPRTDYDIYDTCEQATVSNQEVR